ncbi:MAG: molybdenum cofactor biosynthesis protein MoaE [Arenicellales bacterium]|jgi:molybdopterin synthase catalytic subunit|nr:molybdenum cofactor biosynthesis protein MoaE [Arenicellales bacterium]
MHVDIRPESFDPWQEVAAYRAVHLAGGTTGACAVFVGTMRDFNEGESVQAMQLEHYPGMTEKHLAALAEQAITTHELSDALVLHRVGKLTPGEDIVLVATFSTHRKAAFDACREIMEALKSSAPLWKKETLASGARWVAENTPG